MEPEIKPLTSLLNGHTSAETAFVVDDYPYGGTLRCKKRYWLEDKPKQGTRLVTQTTNPKIAGAEVWNKPHAGGYSPLLVMGTEPETGYVGIRALNVYASPEAYAAFERNYGAMLAEGTGKLFRAMKSAAPAGDVEGWSNWYGQKFPGGAQAVDTVREALEDARSRGVPAGEPALVDAVAAALPEDGDTRRFAPLLCHAYLSADPQRTTGNRPEVVALKQRRLLCNELDRLIADEPEMVQLSSVWVSEEPVVSTEDEEEAPSMSM